MSKTVDIPDELKKSLRKFRFSRADSGSAALVVKIDINKHVMEEVEQFESISLEDLAEELPRNQPRYVLLSYEQHFDDGRRNFPLILINWIPRTCKTDALTLHASALLDFEKTAEPSRVIEVRDGEEELTKEAIDAKLKSMK